MSGKKTTNPPVLKAQEQVKHYPICKLCTPPKVIGVFNYL